MVPPTAPCRDVGMGASVRQEFVFGSYSSFWAKAPPVLVLSPPMTWARPLSVPTAIARRPVGIGALAVHAFVAGLYIVTLASVPLTSVPSALRVRPPKT